MYAILKSKLASWRRDVSITKSRNYRFLAFRPYRVYQSEVNVSKFGWILRTQPIDNNLCTGWNDKIVVLKKTTQQLYFKTFIEKINSGNLIM